MANWNDAILLIRLVLDVLAVWALIYGGLKIIGTNRRTIQIVKGILAIFLIKLVSMWLQLKTVNYLLDIFLNLGMFFVLIVLQPEIRAMLEKVGKSNSAYHDSLPAARTEHLIDELVRAVEDMSKTKTGALITLQMDQSLQDYAQTGISMDSDVTSELLETIFQYGTPMHDGAVIIEGDKLACAATYFPSTSRDLPSKYGARHRAAVGISEVTDSITLVVSEETGNISVAQKGVLTQYNPTALRRFLSNRLIPEEQPRPNSMLQPMIDTARSISSSFGRKNQDNRKKDDRVKPLEVVNMLDDGKEKNNE